MITQIVAISENNAIGKDNKLLWHYSEDLKFFKQCTLNKVMIMGRKTFESFPNPLPKRFHIVITSQKKVSTNEMVIFVTSLNEAIQLANSLISQHQLLTEIMIIGGAQIYKESLTISDKLLITQVPGVYEADTFYPHNYSEFFCKTSEQKTQDSKLIWQTWEKK